MLKPEHLSTLQIRHVIFHDVPRLKHQQPTLSEAPTPMEQAQIAHLRNKLTTVLRSSHANAVSFDIAPPSPVPPCVRKYTTSPGLSAFVPMSQTIAKHLWSLHTGGVSPGLLCDLDVEVRQQYDALVVTKL